MKKNTEFPCLRVLDLQLFAEGGDGGTSGEGATGATEAAAESQTTGVNAPAAEDAPDLDAEFESLIKGKFKEQYGKRTQSTVEKRVKGLNTQISDLTSKNQSAQTILDELSFRYGVDATDTEAMLKAIKADKAYDEQRAFEEGKDLNTYLADRNQKRESLKQANELADLRRQLEESRQRDAFMKQYSEWDKQTEAIKAIYPEYDLTSAMKDETFVRLLNSHIDPRTAYEVINNDKHRAAIMQYAAETAAAKVTNNIIANGLRPIENGNSAQSAAVTSRDVSLLTDKEIDEITRDVARGKRITFAKK